MKKILTYLLIALLAMSMLAGCGKKEAKEPANRLEKILADGVITMATSPDFAPMEFIDDSKEGQDMYVGVDIEFAKYIAENLGVELKIEAMDFSALQTAVSLGQVDMVLAGLAWKEERAEAMELSEFYNVISEDNGQGILVKTTEVDKYQTAEDFSGKTIAVQNASLQLSLLESQLPDAKVEIVTNINDGVMMLIAGKVDGVGVAGTNGITINENYPEVKLSGFLYEYESEGNVVGMPKGETELCEKINEIISKAAAEDLFTKWNNDARNLAAEIGWKN
ncbi:MAG: transporter substrate-binding domain-containing protein [Ruminococcaceae bacterium]|nr:transporter substrate-binding domain-containing protein [Oscillospiraceae bacterium]